jgi:hypothetical protein
MRLFQSLTRSEKRQLSARIESFCPPLGPPWSQDSRRRPHWLVLAVVDFPCADWAYFGPLAMPRLRRPQEPPSRGRGRKRRSEAEPGWTLYAAYLRDFCAYINLDIGKELSVEVDERNRTSRGGQRYASDGRELAHREGLAPWALWDRGKLPDEWWTKPEFFDALAEWASKPTPSIFDDDFDEWKRIEDEEAAKAVCTKLKTTDGDHVISRYVRVKDTLREGIDWRRGLDWSTLFREAHEFFR